MTVASFDRWIASNWRALMYAANSYLPPTEDAEDFALDVYLRARRRLDRFRPLPTAKDYGLVRFLCSIAAELRREARMRRERYASARSVPCASLSDVTDREHVMAVSPSDTPDFQPRELSVMRDYAHGLTDSEIAEARGITHYAPRQYLRGACRRHGLTIKPAELIRQLRAIGGCFA